MSVLWGKYIKTSANLYFLWSYYLVLTLYSIPITEAILVQETISITTHLKACVHGTWMFVTRPWLPYQASCLMFKVYFGTIDKLQNKKLQNSPDLCKLCMFCSCQYLNLFKNRCKYFHKKERNIWIGTIRQNVSNFAKSFEWFTHPSPP